MPKKTDTQQETLEPDDSIDELEKRRIQALHPLTLHINKGEVFGLLGPNGAGKSTTIRTLAGVLTPTAGSVQIDGMDILKHPVESKKKVGYIPDRPYLYDKLTAREFLQFVGQLYDLEESEIRTHGDALLEEHGQLSAPTNFRSLLSRYETAIGIILLLHNPHC